MKHTLKRIAPLSAGKILGVLYGALALIFVPVFLVVMFVASQVSPNQQAMSLLVCLGLMVGLPLVYAVVGFIGGVLTAALYNLFAKWVGGIEVEVE
jgi:hypothetical protein